MRHPDLIIVGVGRSGTTNTARIIHDYFGICLGHIFAEPGEEFEGKPGREDHVVIRYSRSMLQGGHNVEEWLQHWDRSHHREGCTSTLCGVKSTHLAGISREMWLEIAPRLIIRTHRPKELVVTSLHKWRRKQREVWDAFYDEREGMLRKTIDVENFPIPVVHVYYDELILPDGELIDQLRPHVEKLR